ncbi:MAG: SDR family NAD(P)-dependent oxidoreductase [Dehalococcoidia bacterium]
MAEERRPLSGKVAFITGASRGIGRDVAVALAQAGADVVVAARSESVTDPRLPGTIYTVAKEVEARGARALPVKLDVAKDEEIEAAIEKTIQTFGRLDILINNAAILVPGTTRGVQPRHIDLIYRVNLRAPIMIIRAAIDHMAQAGGGHIINVSSRGAVFPGPGPYSEEAVSRARGAFYGMVKAGLERYSQGLAMELQPEGIAVNVLSPAGRIATPGNKFAGNTRENPDLEFEEAVEMAKSSVWLCRQDPRQYTGHILFDKDVVREQNLQ